MKSVKTILKMFEACNARVETHWVIEQVLDVFHVTNDFTRKWKQPKMNAVYKIERQVGAKDQVENLRLALLELERKYNHGEKN